MKTRNLLPLIAVVLIFFPSCKDDEGNNLDIPLTFETYLDVVILPDRGPVEFYGSTDIDPTGNQDFMEHYDNIEQIQLESISARVLDISQEVTLNQATLAVHDAVEGATWTYSDFPISVGTVFTLGNEDGQWDLVRKLFEKKSVFFVEIWGDASHGNVQFTILIENKVKLKGSL